MKKDLKVLLGADLRDKTVLVRVDHNVVKKGRIEDPYRIDATIPTLYAIAARGGRPVLMTHVGRPKDKKTGKIVCKDGESVAPIARYLERKLSVRVATPALPVDPERGIVHIGEALEGPLQDLRAGRSDILYLPNTRWFEGEESKGPERAAFAAELAALAEVYVNDAFGSWQAHASTTDVAGLLPCFAGLLMAKEIAHLEKVMEPRRPFLAVIAGAKYDTKIAPLKILYEKVDALLLGGLMYNTYLAAKYDLAISGVPEEDKALAMELVTLDQKGGKILELSSLVEADGLEQRSAGGFRTVPLDVLRERKKSGYLVDIAQESFEASAVKEAIASAGTIFLNAVMGLMPLYPEGSRGLYDAVSENARALKLFAGGDTLQEYRNLCPGAYLEGMDNPNCYYFTGGGTVLTAIEKGGAFALKPVGMLLAEA